MTPARMLRLHFTKPHVKYHLNFGCDVTRFIKNTRKTESRSQIHQIVFKNPDAEKVILKKCPFCCFCDAPYLQPQHGEWNIACSELQSLHRN